MNAPLRPQAPVRHGFTGVDVLRMQEAGLLLEGGPFELIEGEIIDMPSGGGRHLGLRVELNEFLILSKPKGVSLVPDGTLCLSDDTWPEPDFYLYPAQLRPDAVRGPDVLLIIEISASTLAYDLRRKSELYRHFGVREYWVVDVNAGALHVHRADGAWPAPAVPFTEVVEPSLIPGLSIRITDFLPA
jgi:Uma2 family endonuclease